CYKAAGIVLSTGASLSGPFITRFMSCASEDRSDRWHKWLGRFPGYRLEKGELIDAAKYHYRKIHELIIGHGAKHIVVHYPVRPLSSLHETLRSDSPAKFVTNE